MFPPAIPVSYLSISVSPGPANSFINREFLAMGGWSTHGLQLRFSGWYCRKTLERLGVLACLAEIRGTYYHPKQAKGPRSSITKANVWMLEIVLHGP